MAPAMKKAGAVKTTKKSTPMKQKKVLTPKSQEPQVKKVKGKTVKEIKAQIAAEDTAAGEGDGEEVEVPAEKVESQKMDRLAKAEARLEKEKRGVLYIGHLPDGFHEPQLKMFFEQFGDVTRLRLSRSNKNAASKGYGWIEFAEEAVAKIVKQTMNGYMLFGKTLELELVPREKQHRELFSGCTTIKCNLGPQRRKNFMKEHNSRPTEAVGDEKIPRTSVRMLKSQGLKAKVLQEKLKLHGVNFDLEAILNNKMEGEAIDVAATSEPAKSATSKPSKPSKPVANKKRPAAPEPAGEKVVKKVAKKAKKQV